MRWIRLIFALIGAKFKSKIEVTDTTSLSFRVWLTDIDVSVMNHAAMLTVMEAGRSDFMVRSGFFKVATKNKWFFPSQAISVQYHRPLKLLQKAKLYSRISYVDDNWIYMEQKVMRKGKEIASCLVKSTVKKGRERVANAEIIKALNIASLPSKKYDLIATYELENTQMKSRIVDNWEI